MIAARSRPEVGRALFDKPAEFIGAPNFGRFMNRHHFEELKTHAPVVWESEKNLLDPWYPFRAAVDKFNTNRQRTVNIGKIIVIDESMTTNNWYRWSS